MRNILILLALLLRLSASIIPGAEAAGPEESSDLNTEIIDPVRHVVEATERAEATTSRILSNREPNYSDPYFQDVEVVSRFEDVETLQCPPLKDSINRGDKYNSNIKDLVTKITYIDPKNGVIECSIFNQHASMLTPIHKRQFTAEAYKSNYQRVDAQGPREGSGFNDQRPNLINERALDLNREFVSNLMVSPDTTGDTSALRALNYADMLDAIAGLNTEIIDVENSIRSQTLQLANGYYFVVGDTSTTAFAAKEEALRTLKSATKEVLERNGLSSINPFSDASEEPPVGASEVESLAKNNFVFITEWMLLLKPFLNKIFWMMLFTALAWNSVLLSHRYFVSREKETENRHVISSLFILFSLFVMNSQKTDFAQINEFGAKLEMTTTKLQSFLSLLYKESNEIGDKLSKATIDIYLRSHHQKYNIYGSESIKAAQKAMYQSKYELEQREELEGICSNQFTLAALQNEYTKNGSINTRHASNLYPISESEAFDLLKKPYLSSLKPDFLEVDKLKNDRQIYSFSLCNANLGKIEYLKKEIREAERRIDAFNDVESLELNRAKIQLINQTVWSAYDKYGYFSIAFLPVLDSVQRVMDTFEKKQKQYSELFFGENRLEDLAALVVKNITIMSFFDTSSIQNLIDKIAKILPTSWIPFVGDKVANATAFAATLILIDILSEVFHFIKIGFFVLISIYALVMAWSHKWVTYVISPFTLLHAVAFGKNDQMEKIGSTFGNIVFVSVKPILIIVAIPLALILNVLIHDIYFDMVGNDLNAMLGAFAGVSSSIFAGLIQGVGWAILLVVQFTIIYFMIIKWPQQIAAEIQVKVEDMSVNISQTLEQKIEKKNI